MDRRKLVYLAVFCLIAAFFAGCVPSSARGSAASAVPEAAIGASYGAAAPVSGPSAAADIPWLEADPTAPETPDDASDDIDVTDVDQLMAAARQAAADKQFARADSLLLEVSTFLLRSSRSGNPVVGEERTRRSVSNYVAEIFTIYSELPQQFEVPEEVSSVIFNLHIMEDLFDTLTISSQDSVFLVRLRNKQPSVSYDVPVPLNDRVLKALFPLMRMRKGGLDRWLYNAGHYLPIMKKMFADAGLPQDLAYLPIIESRFEPSAYSRAHAAGIWQFISSTGKTYGLRQDYWIDERRDPLKSTEAAIKYLRKLYGDFGDWHIALASYNCGENGMARAIKRANGVRDYWQLPLPKETMNYVPQYLAALIIAKNQDVFQFKIQDSNIYDPDVVFVNDAIEMSVIADGIKLPLKTLESMNPHIIRCCTPPNMKNVRLYLPKGYADAFNTFYKALPDDKKLTQAALAKLDGSAAAAGFIKKYYKVRKGDALDRIARSLGVSTQDLMKWNKLSKPRNLQVGQKLVYHVKAPPPKPQPVQTAAAKQPAQPAVQPVQPAPAPIPVPAPAQAAAAQPAEPKPLDESVEAVAATEQPEESVPVSDATEEAGEESLESLLSRHQKERAAAVQPQPSVQPAVKQPAAQPAPPRPQTAQPAAQQPKQPAPTPAVQPAPPKPAAEATRKISYKVRKGDALDGIARTYNVTIKELMDWNRLSSPRDLQAGQKLVIHAKGIDPVQKHTGRRVVKRGETLFSIAQELQIPTAELARINGLNAGRPMIFPGDTLKYTPVAGQAGSSVQTASAAPTPQGGEKVRYTVKRGDTLWSISQQFGTSVKAICDENGITTRSKINAGTKLTITRGVD